MEKKIVIKIDDEDYKRIQDIPDTFNSLTSRAYSAIRNGTPLPKGQEPCEDCISREAVLRELDKYLCGVPFNEKGIDEVIKELPPVTPSRPKGKWINNNNDDAGEGYFICSNCKNDVYDVTAFCPNCGADMTESEEQI